MSHIEIPTPHDAAIEALREHARQLDAELADLASRAAIATATRDRLQEVIGSLGRKPRAPRRPRAEPAPDPAGMTLTGMGDAERAPGDPARW